ncbi:oligosaccharide flippase family protein [uncultured Acinetobacter sp.]|uniref:lipopolysaccharide biosynthesis protein n=1 Tax=uncultured Acinetobacter sp. TaxID=165433 RepID=UPI002590E100|nr:oligosaccharide flippase family protein [uncultured Acinetobacter sp.]
MSKLKINIMASYISQIYIVAVSILILPIYMKYMGAEAYGLVGFFAMLQALFGLLDFGLTPTISRQTALYNSGAETALKYRQLFRALTIIFTSIAILGIIFLSLLNKYIALHWLKINHLSLSDVLYCLQIMAFCVGLRWMTGLYRGVISGFEKLGWLSFINTLIATLRYIGVFAYMYYWGFEVKNFFIFQMIVALSEFFLLFIKTNQLIPLINNKQNIGWSIQPVKSVISFALTIAFTSSVWILITQLDKFILSGILTLSDYGYFTLAVLVASGIIQISTPISGAIMPRMAGLYGEKKYQELRKVYLESTQLVAIICVTAGIVLAVFAKQVLFVWTGDIALADKTAPILALYTLGNTALALTAFPYYLQYAKGNLKYHLIGNFILLVLLVPTIIFAAKEYGAIGAGWVWLFTHLVYLIFWVSYVHYKIEHKINIEWYSSFIYIASLVGLVTLSLYKIINFSSNRFTLLIQIILISVLCLTVSLSCSAQVRNYLKSRIVNLKL